MKLAQSHNPYSIVWNWTKLNDYFIMGLHSIKLHIIITVDKLNFELAGMLW